MPLHKSVYEPIGSLSNLLGGHSFSFSFFSSFFVDFLVLSSDVFLGWDVGASAAAEKTLTQKLSWFSFLLSAPFRTLVMEDGGTLGPAGRKEA